MALEASRCLRTHSAHENVSPPPPPAARRPPPSLATSPSFRPAAHLSLAALVALAPVSPPLHPRRRPWAPARWSAADTLQQAPPSTPSLSGRLARSHTRIPSPALYRQPAVHAARTRKLRSALSASPPAAPAPRRRLPRSAPLLKVPRRLAFCWTSAGQHVPCLPANGASLGRPAHRPSQASTLLPPAASTTARPACRACRLGRESASEVRARLAHRCHVIPRPPAFGPPRRLARSPSLQERDFRPPSSSHTAPALLTYAPTHLPIALHESSAWNPASASPRVRPRLHPRLRLRPRPRYTLDQPARCRADAACADDDEGQALPARAIDARWMSRRAGVQEVGDEAAPYDIGDVELAAPARCFCPRRGAWTPHARSARDRPRGSQVAGSLAPPIARKLTSSTRARKPPSILAPASTPPSCAHVGMSVLAATLAHHTPRAAVTRARRRDLVCAEPRAQRSSDAAPRCLRTSTIDLLAARARSPVPARARFQSPSNTLLSRSPSRRSRACATRAHWPAYPRVDVLVRLGHFDLRSHVTAHCSTARSTAIAATSL
ncbi:hypothetical protein B0H15DRAFT_974469 [Mycena belliarum]|uniref:Uncharacterized protein n=1 Tax=Mycena belliarum TaxID=1033014 RepID=A0AAD6TMS5_9AGAR|nr:hypothetical protein B0H15DRAFT_974469 [Mycena belliae]